MDKFIEWEIEMKNTTFHIKQELERAFGNEVKQPVKSNVIQFPKRGVFK